MAIDMNRNIDMHKLQRNVMHHWIVCLGMGAGAVSSVWGVSVPGALLPGALEHKLEATGSTDSISSSLVMISSHCPGDWIVSCSIICFGRKVVVLVQWCETVRKSPCVLFLSWLQMRGRSYSLPALAVPKISAVEICMTLMLPLWGLVDLNSREQ